jgi:hypothetical protein
VTPDQPRPYATPAALRRALTDKLRTLAAPKGPWPLADLQRQFAYDRVLSRLYILDQGWVVKGATALLARGIAVRHTVDIDLYRATTTEQAERDLRAAAAPDLSDWFTFELGRAVPTSDAPGGLRIPLVAYVGTAAWARFRVDLVAEGIRMTGPPEDVPPLAAVHLRGLEQPGYQAYPLFDHLADKVCAILQRYGPERRPSTRFKDLVDLVGMTPNVRVEAEALRRALLSEADRRGLTLPTQFDVANRMLWERGYVAEARRAVRVEARTLDDALAVVRPFLDPILDATASGAWAPDQRRWVG